MKGRVVISILIVCFILALPSVVFARSYRTRSSDVYVHGYYRKNGTYVQPHYRSAPDGITSNNYSCIDDGRCGGSGSRGDGGGDVSSSYIYVPVPISTPIIHPDNPVTTGTVSIQEMSTKPFHNVYVIWNGTENTNYSISLTKNAGSEPGPISDTSSPTFAFHNEKPGKWYVNLKTRIGGQWSKITYWPVDIPQWTQPTPTPTATPTQTLLTQSTSPSVKGISTKRSIGFWEFLLSLIGLK